MPRYTHQCSIAFTVISSDEDGNDFTADLLRTALEERILGLVMADDAEWREAVEITDTAELPESPLDPITVLRELKEWETGMGGWQAPVWKKVAEILAAHDPKNWSDIT